jgi:hypothetical protein
MPALLVALLGICAAVGSVIYGMIRWIKEAGKKFRSEATAAEASPRSGHMRASRILFRRALSTAIRGAPVTQEK